MTITAKIIADSVSPSGDRLTTLQLCYPRFIHSEFMTHRVFSRNASSSRAVPVKKMIKQVWSDPAAPIHWGKNQPGMQAHEQLAGVRFSVVRFAWHTAAKLAASVAWLMDKAGAHKQVANRILEPFQFIHVIVTATDWDNFFALRMHVDAQPEIFALAIEMKMAIDGSTPEKRNTHMPYILPHEMDLAVNDLMMISAARCARVSYLTHDGKKPNIVKDMDLAEKLRDSGHASPFEHSGIAKKRRHANFMGWQSYRSELGI